MADTEVKNEAPEAVAVEAPVADKTQEAPAGSEEVAATESVAESNKIEDEAKPQDNSKGTREGDDPAPMIKTTAKIDPKNTKKNVKYDPKSLPSSDDPAAIRSQVEFYFSDSNLPIDKFMWTNTSGTENKAVPLKIIATFGRMRRFQPYEKIVEALKESNTLVLEGEAGEETLKRKVPYSSEKRDNVNAKSVYVKGFGDEKPSTQFELEAFFTRFGSVSSVRLRRTPEKLFKGSVFVEFVDDVTQKKFLELDPKPIWNGHELLIMSKSAYVQSKCEQIREGKIQPSSKPSFFEGKVKGDKFQNGHQKGGEERRNDRGRGGFRGGRGGRGGRGRGGRGRGNRDGHRDGRNDGPHGPAVDVAAVDVAAAEISAEKAAPDTKGAKRQRDEDVVAQEPPAKKIDAKGEASVEAAA